MANRSRLTDALRRDLNEVENHLVDGFLSGEVSRREFLRHGSLLGISLPVLGAISGTGLGLLGAPGAARAASGGTLRIASITPAGAIDPVSISDIGGLLILQQVGDFLCNDGPDLILRPSLAKSWAPSQDNKVWTFKLRDDVKFHDGSKMTAADVVATFDRLSDPKNSSNALSAMKGFLSPGGTKKVDDYTVEFHLEAPNGSWPYQVSSDNYNAIIVPASYNGGFEKTFNGTGPFKLDKYTPKQGASFVRNPDYWGPKALLDRTEFTFYADQQPMILALQGGQVDLINQISVLSGVGLLNDPHVNIISVKSAAHEQVHMRCDMDPFKDKRVRQAVALCLDRPRLVRGLMKGRAIEGNDSPFASIFPSTDKSVKQREKNIADAKKLAQAAGLKPRTKVTLITERYLEIPDYAAVLQNAVKPIGLDVTLQVLSQDAYYGDAVFGKSNWLDSSLGITDYGHRGVPNVYLNAPLKSAGTWNAAHFKSAEYDQLVDSYIATSDLRAQRETAGKIERLLLDETPVLFSYFYDFLTPTSKHVRGVQTTAMGQLFLAGASKTT